MRFSSRHFSIATGLALLGLFAVACQSAPDLTALRSAVIAEVPGAKLTGADLERWLMASPEMPTADAAAYLTSSWVDQALFAEAIRQEIPLGDTVVVDSLIWADATMATLGNFYLQRAGTAPAITDQQADSLFDRGEVKVFQRLKIAVKPEGDTVARARAESRAEVIRTAAVAGEDFSKLVRENSEDPQDKASGGLLPAVTRDSLPEGQMYGHLWTLRPGDYSRVFSNDVAAVMFTRPKSEVARPMMKRYLSPILRRRADSVFVDSLVHAKQVVVAKGAADRLRALAAEPMVLSGTGPLVSWTEGQIDAAKVHRWLLVMDANRRMDVAQMSDVEAEAFLLEMARRELVLAVSGMPIITPAVRAGLGGLMSETIAELRQNFKSGPGDKPAADLPTVLLDSLTIALKPYRPIPNGLAGYLRSRYDVKVDVASRQRLLAAVQIKYGELHAGDKKAGTPPTP